MLIGLVTGFMVSDKQRQQLSFDATGLGVRVPLVRRPEYLGEVEGDVDGHQRVEGERDKAEPRGPDRSSPRSRSHSARRR